MSGDGAGRDPAGFAFAVTGRDAASRARTGRLTTPHGTIDTPAFIFCGTKATVKGLTMGQVRAAGADIVLANTYHLMIQPGAEVVAALGGLHRMTGWDGPMLTDSGGFQIFSMGHGSVADEIKGRRNQARAETLVRIDEEGARFRSYKDGRELFLTPEGAMQIQRALGADLVVQLDECTPFHAERDYTARSMEMSARWGDRSLAEFARTDDGRQAVYGVVQGGTWPDLRRVSTEYTADRPFFGTAVGGTLGGDKEEMRAVVAMCADHWHPARPVHLLGIGGIADILAGVALGIDSFDCVSPTRVARHGWALKKGVPGERINLRNARFRTDDRPIDETCDCATCRTVSTGYLHHLFKAGELTGASLVSQHNIATMTRLMREIRAAIPGGGLDALRHDWLGE